MNNLLVLDLFISPFYSHDFFYIPVPHYAGYKTLEVRKEKRSSPHFLHPERHISDSDWYPDGSWFCRPKVISAQDLLGYREGAVLLDMRKGLVWQN
jgi:hypothetical protein